MSRLKTNLPSPAMVVACVALIVAAGGTAYAALGKDSVKSKQIAKNAVKAQEIARGAVKKAELARRAVTTAKLTDGAVTTGKLADGAVSSEKVLDGSIRSADLGPLGVKLENLGVVVNSRFTDAPLPDDGTRVSATAECPAGQVAIGGGSSFATAGPTEADDFTTDFRLLQSRPTIVGQGSGFPDQGSGFNGWRVSAVNDPGAPTGAETLTAMVVCLRNAG